jgi:MoaA/NifB/PqqE/SkfB family radical SAM enzyme
MHWTLSLADFFFRSKVLGRRLPLLASFKLTYGCNLTCRACPFHRKAGGPAASMDWATATGCLDELKKRGCRIVVFEGGEPLLWRDGSRTVHDIIGYARQRFLRTAVTTNGTLPLDVPAHVVWVSIDGLPATHDHLRGGSFERIRRNLLRTRHPKVLVHHTVNRANCGELPALMDLLAAIPSMRGLTLQFFYPYGQGEADLALSPEQRRETVKTAIALKQRGYPILNSTAVLRAMIGNVWTCPEHILVNADPDGTITQGCYAKSRGSVRCDACGFTPVAEAAGALRLRPGSLVTGWKTFISG